MCFCDSYTLKVNYIFEPKSRIFVLSVVSRDHGTFKEPTTLVCLKIIAYISYIRKNSLFYLGTKLAPELKLTVLVLSHLNNLFTRRGCVLHPHCSELCTPKKLKLKPLHFYKKTLNKVLTNSFSRLITCPYGSMIFGLSPNLPGELLPIANTPTVDV